jgi:hypothetical protein
MKEELNKRQSQIDDDPTVDNLHEYSYEKIFNVYKDDHHYAYNILRTVHIPKVLDSDIYTYVRIQGKTSWTQLSYHEYRTIRLWWLICATNKIMNPVILPVPGMVIKIIKPQYVRSVVEQIKVELEDK